MSAVSLSRISPTITMSGSCRRIDRRAEAKSSPISLRTETWLTPWSSYSIGSSTVTDRKSTRLNSSHVSISYAVFCLKKKIKREYLMSEFYFEEDVEHYHRSTGEL